MVNEAQGQYVPRSQAIDSNTNREREIERIGRSEKEMKRENERERLGGTG